MRSIVKSVAIGRSANPIHHSRNVIKHWWENLAIISLGALGILSICLLNGYPLVYSDTGTYLRSAFTGYVPDDRPYWYGLFIQITSLNGLTLWGTVTAQALLCSALLWRCWREFGDGRAWTFLLSITILAPFTGLGWYAGQLVADIFSVIGVLAGMLFLLASGAKAARVARASLMVLACMVHLSNLLILPLVLGTLWLVLYITKVHVPRSRVVALFCTLILAWPGLMISNNLLTGEAYTSKYSHVFLMSRMAESGILRTWLDEHCPDERYGICAFRDSIPTTNKAFMWSDRSPLQWQGGPMAVRHEYRSIIHSTFAEPRYIGMHIVASLTSTWELLQLWRVADELEGTYYRQDYSAPYGAIAELIPRELPAYLGSQQNTGNGELGLQNIDQVYRVLLGLALIGSVFLLFYWRTNPQELLPLVVGIGTFVFGAWVCASLSTVDSRFMARTAWLLPWMVVMVGWKISARRRETGQPFHT